MIKKTLQYVYTIYVMIVFFVCFMSAFPIICVFSLSKRTGAMHAIGRVAGFTFRLWFFISGMPLKFIGKRPDKKKYVFVGNHISNIDNFLIHPSIRQYVLVLGKPETEKIPFFGYFYKHVVIMVDRRSAESRAESMRKMLDFLTTRGSIFIYPEGTFNETGAPLKEFYDGAFRLAINAQTDILPMIFPDTTYRCHYSAWWKMSPGRNRAIYLEPVSVAGMTLDDLPKLKQQVHSIMEKALIESRA